jgi:hypothetical protein
MSAAATTPVGRVLRWGLGLVLVTTIAIAGARALIPAQYASPSFICFWAGGELVAAGESPYDAAAQTRVQHAYGWDKDADGYGFWDFLPYYYPPSLLAPLSVALLPLGYPTARIAWLVLNVELLVLTGILLRGVVTGVAGWIPIVAVTLFAPSIFAVLVGQLSPLVLFTIVAVWRLLQLRADRAAGWLLAWMTVKPQLTGLFVAAMLLWAFRRDRRGVPAGFASGTLVLVAVSTLVIPSWPVDLARALVGVPLPTADRPWVGATWLLVLRSLGIDGALLGLGYLAVVVPLFALVGRAVWDATRPLDEVVALSMLVPFFAAPYARAYDFPLLVIPLLLLLGGRLPAIWTALFPTVFLLLPLLHFWRLTTRGGPGFTFLPQVWLFWIPAVLTAAWVLTERRSLPEPSSARAPAGRRS